MLKQMKKNLKTAYENRDTIKILALKDLKIRYAHSLLGFGWSVLEPLLIILVYSLIFPFILHVSFKDFVLFFICGLIPYRFFRNGLMNVTQSLVNFRSILTKTHMPVEIVPISIGISNLISFLLESLVFLGIVFLSGIIPTYLILFLPALFLIEFLIIMGLGFYLSIHFIKLRDITYILNVLFEVLMFLTPIIYRIDVIPELYRGVYMLNPISRLIVLYQTTILRSTPNFVEYISVVPNIIYLFIFSLIVIILGYISFMKKRFDYMGEL